MKELQRVARKMKIQKDFMVSCDYYHVADRYYSLDTHVVYRDLRYISIWQYIDTVIEYRIVILCSMNIEVSKWLCSAE